MESSFYVGDAAGRKYLNGTCDHSDSDLLFAKAINFQFFTPEQFFSKHSAFNRYVRFVDRAMPFVPNARVSESPRDSTSHSNTDLIPGVYEGSS